ncbi:MAG: LamG domain-containing protein [Sedimentisphaerales bacterium]|nr:LamG domain-containing protein [Sedimentisphaerales bacterium]
MPRLKPTRGTLIRISHPLARGLTGCWLFGEGTGQTVGDHGPYRQHGSFYGGTALWKPGRHGYCLQFDGTDVCIDCGTGKFGWDMTNELSVVAFVNHGASQTNTVFARSAFVRPVRLLGQNGGKFMWRVFTDTENDCTLYSTSSHATDGSEWIHVAGTWKPYGGYLYVNGVQEASDTSTEGNLNLTDDQFVGIGGTYETSGFVGCWNGSIEYVFIYNRALSVEEIKRLYQDPFAMFDRSISSAPIHAPVSIVSLTGSVNAISVTSARLETISSSAKIKASWLSDALFNGMTANALKLSTTLTLGWFWTRVTGCSALYRGSAVNHIDFTNILTVTDQDATIIAPHDSLPHDNSTTYFYVIRRFNHCGDWEQTIRAAAKVSIDADGELVAPLPNKIFISKIKQVDGNKICLTWFYNPLEQQSPPACFNVYFDGTAGQIDYENALATIKYKGHKFYSYTSDVLQPGRYLFAVKAEDSNGNEYDSSAHLPIELNGIDPDTIDIIAVETI